MRDLKARASTLQEEAARDYEAIKDLDKRAGACSIAMTGGCSIECLGSAGFSNSRRPPPPTPPHPTTMPLHRPARGVL